MNKVILIGNLTNDPELTTTNLVGISVCKFGLAVKRKYKEDETDFFNITVWRSQGENAHKYLSKGNKAGISGSIQIRQYDDKDGKKRYYTDIVADEVEFLTPKGNNSPVEQREDDSKGNVQQGGIAEIIEELEPITDDDLPF